MSTEVIKDYGKTVSAETYIKTLQEHQYIPQADQCIKNIVRNFCETHRKLNSVILDLGCGPGRLTCDLGIKNSQKIGLDISQSFIDYAWSTYLKETRGMDLSVSFVCADFLLQKDIENSRNEKIKEFDVIVMQGVMHHIQDNERDAWLEKCFNLLKNAGVLVIGDEFIRYYEDEEQRKIFVAQFYCHIIHEAIKGGFIKLAEEEAKNLIDDAFSGTNYAGLATDETIKHIFNYCSMINQMFYADGILRSEGYNQTQNLLRGIRESINNMTNDDPQKNFNRGNFKTSIPKFIPEVIKHGFVLTERYEIGPVQQLGGMGVLVFKKNK